MSRDLTPREADVLRALSLWIRDHGFPPSMRELGEAVGLASTRSVSEYLERLEGLGYIRRHRDRSRAIEILGGLGEEEVSPDSPTRDPVEAVTVPVYGEVAAGYPIVAEQNMEEEIAVDPSMVRDERTYMLRVRGDSMIEAHICDGDYILVHPAPEARNGEIVVAMIEGDVTLKRFYRRDGYVELKPENSDMASILVHPEAGDIRILGKLQGVVRRY